MKMTNRLSPNFSLVRLHEYRRQLDQQSPDFDQDYALARLLWYLNSGGRRSYVVVERPDKSQRNLPRADYVCQDGFTGAYVTVEVTKIYHNPQIRKIEEFRIALWYDVAKKVEGRLPGTFILGVPARILINQRQWRSVRDDIVTSLGKVAVDMRVFEKRRLPYQFSLTKMFDYGTGLDGPVVNGDWENDPAQSISWDQQVEAIEKPLDEAVGKLSAYARGVKAVLLDCKFFMEYLDVREAISEINREKYTVIDRLYLLNVEHRGTLIRAW